MHLPEKRSGVVPQAKTIFGLARKDDGHRMAHPPHTRLYGAGAKDVEFWLDGKASSSSRPKAEAKGGAKGKEKGKAEPENSAVSGSGKYISVFDFFRTSTLSIP
jgi:hypothetical protein